MKTKIDQNQMNIVGRCEYCEGIIYSRENYISDKDETVIYHEDCICKIINNYKFKDLVSFMGLKINYSEVR